MIDNDIMISTTKNVFDMKPIMAEFIMLFCEGKLLQKAVK